MKNLKFSDSLVKLVLNNLKNTTWRINDDKWFICWDIFSLCYNSWEIFAEWEVLWTKETSFENLTLEDKDWHEIFSSEEEMYKTYSWYYNRVVSGKTKLKVIKFRLIKVFC